MEEFDLGCTARDHGGLKVPQTFLIIAVLVWEVRIADDRYRISDVPYASCTLTFKRFMIVMVMLRTRRHSDGEEGETVKEEENNV